MIIAMPNIQSKKKRSELNPKIHVQMMAVLIDLHQSLNEIFPLSLGHLNL
jgi:hypothetical protein